MEPGTELSPTSASRQFSTPEEFAEWLASSSSTHSAAAEPVRQFDNGVEERPRSGSIIDRMMDAISPHSSGAKSSRSSLEDFDASPSSLISAEEVVPLYLQEDVAEIEDKLSPKSNIRNRMKQREADRLGITVEELDEVLTQEPQGGSMAGCYSKEQIAPDRSWSTAVNTGTDAVRPPVEAIDQAITETLELRDPDEVDKMRRELFACCEAEFALSAEEAEIWRGVWCDFDTDQDGMLARADLQARWLEMFNQELSERQLDAAMGSCSEGTGISTYMTYYDFLQFVNGKDQDGLQVIQAVEPSTTNHLDDDK